MTTIDQPTPPSREREESLDIVELGVARVHDPVASDAEVVDASKPQRRNDRSASSITGPKQVGAALRQLLNRYELAEGDDLPSVIAVVSALRGEGVTTMSKALAELLVTDFGARVCWIDLSWDEHPEKRGKNAKPLVVHAGISEILNGTAELDDVLESGETEIGVQFLHGGDVASANRHRLARHPELDELIERLASRFDFLVLDVAPVLSTGDALALLRLAEAYILVARYGVTTTRQLATVAGELSTVPSIGAILNQYQSRTPKALRRRFAQ